MAKPFIDPIFVAPSSVIAIVPFRYVWNNPPAFAAKNLALAILTPVAVCFVVSFGLSWLMTLAFRRWNSR